jgi:hypothetical protein
MGGGVTETLSLPNGLVYEIHDGFVRSVFPDGAEAVGVFDYSPESLARADALGYLDATVMHREHDLAHHLVAQALGHPWSPVLHALARGQQPRARHAFVEERMALLVARAANVGVRGLASELVPA